MTGKIALLAMLVVLAVVNWSIAGKEKHLAEGKVVYLELAPRDPRSLMQGDYMALQFQVARDVYKALPKHKQPGRWQQDVKAGDGYVVVKLDDKHVGTFQGLYEGGKLSKDELLMRYRVRDGRVKYATNAFFFQEGHASIYQPARYGQFRVADNGELLLVAMFDEKLNKLEPPSGQ
ncbi:MAG: GDYXXLXY domain-containing protein [Thiohalophilus sp.]|jgi:uncharacterized membrane-anchored protein